MLRSPLTSRLLVLTAAVLFSTGGAAIKAAGVTGWQVASFRSLIAALFLLLLVPAARRGWNRRVWIVGVAYAVTLVLFALSMKLTTAANAISLQSAAPLYLLLLGPLLLKEPVRRTDLFFLLPVALGMALLLTGSRPPSATASNPALGNLLAAATGVSWALTLAGLRWLGRTGNAADSAMPAVVAGNILAFLLALPAALPVVEITARDVAVLLYLGVFQVGVAYVCMTRGLRHVPAFEASTLLLIDPPLNPLWAWLAHNEQPGARALAGGAIILAATLASSWWHGRAGKTPSQPA